MSEMLPLNIQILDNSIIKVLGVGGGGCNAVNYMYRQGIHDVSFLVCNTDSMALEKMSVPAKLQIGPGLGAGGRPQVAHQYAEENENRIREALDDGTRMVFITAGMGGGTGTGASPVVAKVAQEMGILTVGIVTIPFAFEGNKAIRRAMRGIAELAQYTDALLVINNEKLKLLFPDFDLPNAFDKADEVVCNAAKSIAEIITVPGYINTDFQDVYNTLKDGNVAIMNVGMASGENRITRAIENALNSPLVNTNDVSGASRILLNFYCSKEYAIRMQELEQVQEFCNSVGDDVDVKWGASYDDSLAENVKVTIIATGYNVSDIPGLDEAILKEETETDKQEKPKQQKITQEQAAQRMYDFTRSKNGSSDQVEVPDTGNTEIITDEPLIIIDEVQTEQNVATEIRQPQVVHSTDTEIKIDDEKEKTEERRPSWKPWLKRR